MRYQRKPIDSPGFTLIEVLAAISIFAVAAFVLLDAHYTALNLHTMVDEEINLRQFVESTSAKAEVELLAGNLSGGGDFGPRYSDYSWTFSASPVGQDETDLLYLVHVTISGPGEPLDIEFYSYDTGMGDEDKEGGSSASKSKSGSNSRSSDSKTSGNGSSHSGRSGFSNDSGSSRSSGSFGGSGFGRSSSGRSGRGGSSSRSHGSLFN